MDRAMGNSQTQTCPQCENHCPVDALRCGKGRKYFGVTDDAQERGHSREHDHGCGHSHEHDHGCGHRQLGGLPGLLHQCGRFVRHAGLEEDELFQALTSEEKASLQALLEKLSADWQARSGQEALSRCGHGHHGHNGEKHHHKHEDHDR